jgi:hypothetical protein
VENRRPPIDTQDEEVRQQSWAAMPSEIRLLDDTILHLNHGTALFSGREHDDGLNLLSALLISRAFNSLWRAREDALCGYSVQSLSLCRGALEDWGTLIWVELHPTEVDKWLWAVLPEIEQPPGVPPTFAAIWKELDESGKIPAEAYDALSKFAHPKSIGLRWLVEADPDFTRIHFGGHFDSHGLKICLFFLVQVAQAFFERVARLQERLVGEPKHEWLAEGRRLSQIAVEFVERFTTEEMLLRGKNKGDGTL